MATKSGSEDWYERNPETTGDRRLSRSSSAWARSFSCEDVRPLVVCRGPIRKEAMDVFTEMGIAHHGILLSEKDSIVYTHALAPELRRIRPEHVHRVRDYSGATKEERRARFELVRSSETPRPIPTHSRRQSASSVAVSAVGRRR